MDMSKDDYIKGLQADNSKTIAYYNKSLHQKTEQQKFLEKLLLAEGRQFEKIADIACGGGSLSYHLSQQFPQADFTLVDYNDDALVAAKQNNLGPRFRFFSDSIYYLKNIPNDSFDLVCCWQTLSWLSEPEKALKELVRITRPQGKIFASSLFNLEKDVDLYTKVLDHTRNSGANGLAFDYNTYSRLSVEKWLQGLAKEVEIKPFHPEVDFEFVGRGIGTHTIQALSGTRLQISAGMLLNWGVLIVTK